MKSRRVNRSKSCPKYAKQPLPLGPLELNIDTSQISKSKIAVNYEKKSDPVDISTIPRGLWVGGGAKTRKIL